MPSYFPPVGGITQAELDAELSTIRKDREVIIKTEADLLALYTPDGFGGIQLEDKDYYFDASVFVTTYHLYLSPYNPSAPFIFTRIFGNGIIQYSGAGAFIRDNPNGVPSGGIVVSLTGFFGDGTNQLFDLKNSLVAIACINVVVAQFLYPGTIRNVSLLVLSQIRVQEIGNPFMIKDVGQARIFNTVDQSSVLSGKTYYDFSGVIPIISFGGEGQVTMLNPLDTYIRIDPTTKFDSISVNSIGISPAAGGPTSGLLFQFDLDDDGTGVLSDNGAGFVRLTQTSPHGLTDKQSIYLSGANDYRYNGFFIDLISTTVFDLMDDYGAIVSFADAGGGLINVNLSSKHILSDGDTVEIISGTYNGNYVVSGINPLTPFTFQITEVFTVTDTGEYKKFRPFTTAGESVKWYRGSLNESTPNITTFNNGKEIPSSFYASVIGLGAGNTNVTTTPVPINATYTEQADCDCQRTTVFNDGRIYSDSTRTEQVSALIYLFGRSTTGSGVELEFTVRKNGVDVSTLIFKETVFNSNQNIQLNISLQMDKGDYIEPVVRVAAGTATFILENSLTYLTRTNR